MQLQSNYDQHVALSKELKMNQDFINVREPYKEDFETIYSKAKESNITMSNAKEFLNSLTREELNTLQNYTRLADEINVGKLNDEGAYNLLLHHYEKFDFDNDGVVSDGISKTQTMLPPNMPYEDKKVLVETLNSMDEKDSFMAMMMIHPPKFKFENGEIIPDNSNEIVTFKTIMENVNRILNPLPGEYSSPELKTLFEAFKERYEENYEAMQKEKGQTAQAKTNELQAMKAKLAT